MKLDKYKFKVGDEVYTYQTKRKGGKNVYIYGYNTEHLPLKSDGKIFRVNEKYGKEGTAYLVQFKEFSAWIHEDELQFLDSLQKIFNRCADLKNFENHPAFEIARQNPVFLIDEKVYSVELHEKYHLNINEKSIERKLEAENPNELGSFADLDELIFQRSSAVIEKIQKEYVDEVKKDVLQIINQTAFIPQLIIKHIFPYLRKEDIKEKIDELIQEEYKPREQTEKINKNSSLNNEVLENTVKKAVEKIESLIKNIEIEEYEYIKNGKKIDEYEEKRKEMIEELLLMNDEKKESENHEMKNHFSEPTSFMEKIINENIAIIDGKVYECLPEETKKTELKITLDEKDFYLKKTLKNLDFLEEKYLFELYKKIRIDALKENFTKEKIEQMLEEENKKLPESKGDEYSEQDFGYLKNNEHYYAYLEVPAFAIKSQFDNNYYLFDKMRIGLQINSHNQKIRPGGITVIDNNNHPFLHKMKGNFTGICIGGNQLPTTGKDEGDLVARILHRVKHALMYGYLADDKMRGGACDELRTICNGCEQDHFANHRKELSELKQMGVPIITKEVFNKRNDL